MRLSKIISTIALLVLMPAKGYAQCEAYWLDLGGRGQGEHLTLPISWPFLQFANNSPYWDPARYDANGRFAGPASKSELQWSQVSTPPSVETVGRVGRHPVSAISYSATSRVLVWDRGGSSWCPVAILDGDESIVAFLGDPKIFVWRRTEIMSQRIFYTGMGGLQDSLFFAVVKGALVHLRQDDGGARRFIESNKITLSTRGGGFCEGTLTWEAQAWKGEIPTDQVGTLRLSYGVDGNRLVVESASLVSDVAGKNCDQYPKSKTANRRLHPSAARTLNGRG